MSNDKGRHNARRFVIGSTLAAAAALLPAAAPAQEVGEIIVSASRLPASVETMPQSVDILEAEALQKQLAVTADLEQVLGNLVPGLSRSSNSSINTYTSLRGRKPVFLIDGVPITSTLNDVGRELRLIDPDTIARIEVVRGSSALYGNSAGAGFINYITKSGEPGPLALKTEVGAGASLTQFGDSLRPSVRQSASGTLGAFDYRLQGSYEETNSFFDADGDRIPPIEGAALQDSTFRSFFGKAGYEWGGNHRLEGSLSYFKQKAKLLYRVVNGNVVNRIKATAVQTTPFPDEVPQKHENLTGSLVYTAADLFDSGSTLRAQLYMQDSESIFQYARNRFPLVPSMPHGQSANDTRKWGSRLDVTTPLDTGFLAGGQVLWGIDYVHDRTEIPLVDGRDFGLPQTLDSYAPFLQVQIEPVEGLTLSGGVRHERSSLKIDDFQSLFTLKRVTDGDLEYRATPVNVGAVYEVTPLFDVFAGYSQGFETQQLSFTFRATPVDISLAQFKPKPNLIDNYEAGVRVHGDGFDASAAVFQVESTNGVSYVLDPRFPTDAQAVRAPDKVYGYELTASFTGIEDWTLGGTFAWMEGKSDTNNDGSFETPLQNRRIPPEKLTLYAEYAFAPGSFIRLQGLYSGDRNKFPNSIGTNRFHEGKVTSYVEADLSATFRVLETGQLSIGINNLFNEEHFTNYAEGNNRNESLVMAQGRNAFVRFSVTY